MILTNYRRFKTFQPINRLVRERISLVILVLIKPIAASLRNDRHNHHLIYFSQPLKMSAQLKLKELSPELRTLPEGYVIKVDRSSHSRIYFQKGRKTSYVHPTLGPLPDPWIFSLYIIDPEKGTRAPVYYNPDTNQIKDHDPRYDSDHLQQKSKGANHSMATMLSGSVRRNAPGRMEEYARAEIGLKNIRHAFVEVHNIDPGDGTGGGSMFVLSCIYAARVRRS